MKLLMERNLYLATESWHRNLDKKRENCQIQAFAGRDFKVISINKEYVKSKKTKKKGKTKFPLARYLINQDDINKNFSKVG